MNSIKVKSELIARLEQEVKRQILVVKKEFAPLDNKQLLRQSEDNGWSILQNLEHLNIYYKYYLPAISDALEAANDDTSASYKSGWLRRYFITAMEY